MTFLIVSWKAHWVQSQLTDMSSSWWVHDVRDTWHIIVLLEFEFFIMRKCKFWFGTKKIINFCICGCKCWRLFIVARTSQIVGYMGVCSQISRQHFIQVIWQGILQVLQKAKRYECFSIIDHWQHHKWSAKVKTGVWQAWIISHTAWEIPGTLSAPILLPFPCEGKLRWDAEGPQTQGPKFFEARAFRSFATDEVYDLSIDHDLRALKLPSIMEMDLTGEYVPGGTGYSCSGSDEGLGASKWRASQMPVLEPPAWPFDPPFGRHGKKLFDWLGSAKPNSASLSKSSSWNLNAISPSDTLLWGLRERTALMVCSRCFEPNIGPLVKGESPPFLFKLTVCRAFVSKNKALFVCKVMNYHAFVCISNRFKGENFNISSAHNLFSFERLSYNHWPIKAQINLSILYLYIHTYWHRRSIDHEAISTNLFLSRSICRLAQYNLSLDESSD